MRELISVAATLGLATSRKTLLEGSTVRNVYTGHSGVMGLWASRLIETGFTGEPTGVQSAFGEVLGDAFDETSLSQGLRSEEHTSELQSLMRISYAVFCLKKKKI